MNIEHGVTATKDLELNITPAEGVENFASDEELVQAVSDYVDKKVTDNISALEDHWDRLVHYDYMFRCGLNAAEKASNRPMASPEEPKSNVGATMFFRQIMQSAAKLYAFQTSRDTYWKYTPISTAGVPMSAEESEMQAAMFNSLIKWNLKQDNFDPKLMAIDIAICKDGLAFVGLNWLRRKEDRVIKVPGAPNEDGTTAEPQTIELKGIVTENRGEVILYDPFSVIADPNIDSIQNQECPAVTEVIPFGKAIDLVEAGYWDEDQFRTITDTHGWDGSAGRPKKSDIEDNSGTDGSNTSDSGMLLVWNVWAMLPISDDGKLDQKKYRPRRYVCTFVGNKIGDSVCVRISRNDEPDDLVPFEAIHDYPDSMHRLFHICKGQVLKNNFAVEVTTVNQMIDGVSCAMQPPTIERKGAVLSKDRKFGRGSRIVVRDSVSEDMREYAVPDRTQTGIALLNYIKDDSKMAIHTDPSQMGEGLGSRATATESSGVMRLSAAPSVMNAKYATVQLFGFLGKRLKRYWQMFSVEEQVVRITDSEASIHEIKPSEIYGDFDIEVDVVDQVVEDILSEQKIAQDMQVLGGNEALAQKVDWDALLEEYFIRRYGKSYVVENMDVDAINEAQKDAKRVLNGERVLAQEGQNHRMHLKVLQAEMVRYRGVEKEFKLQVDNLKALIESHKNMMGMGPKAPQQPPEAQGVAMGGEANMPALPGMPGMM